MPYTKTTDFASKDTLLSGNPAKLIRGTEIDAEFVNIQTEDAINVKLTATQTVSNKTIVAADNLIVTAATGNLAATELNAALAELQTSIDTAAHNSLTGLQGGAGNERYHLTSAQHTNAANTLVDGDKGDVVISGSGTTMTVESAAGNFAVAGNTTLGDASTDTVTVNGYMGVGGAPNQQRGVLITGSITTGVLQGGIGISNTLSSAATTFGTGINVFQSTAAASFTMADYAAYYASNVTKGAGSAVTNQHGVYIQDLNSGVSNYGITSLVSSGTNKWNIYASGTAANYLQGSVGIGTNSPATYGKLAVAGNIAPTVDNTYSFGTATFRASVVYAGTGTINTSDAREKTAVRPLTAAEINAAKQLAAEIGAYQFLSAVAEKGDAAREHIGMTVQRAIEIMEANGLAPFNYGFICYDSWDDIVIEHPEVPAQDATYDDEGNELTPAVEYQAAWTEVVREAGDIYSFRPDELLLFIARGFDARLAALENP